MSNKIAWIDVETTGLDAREQDIIQLAVIMEIDNVEVDRIEIKCQPFSWDNVQQRALDVHGYSINDLRTFQSPQEGFAEFELFMKRYINPFDKKDKCTFAGYNSPFDVGFVRHWFKKNGSNFFGSYFKTRGYHSLDYDVFPLFVAYAQGCDVVLPNHKLVTAAEHFGIPLEAHDAMADIVATREVAKRIGAFMKMGYDLTQEAIRANDTYTSPTDVL